MRESPRVSNNGPVRVVCFDLGGVIIRIQRTWVDTCRAVGLDVRDGVHDEALVMAARSVAEAFGTGAIAEDRWGEEMTAAFRGLYSREELVRIHEGWILDEYPGVVDVISTLNRVDGLVTACLSNTNARHWRLMHERYPAFNLIQHRHASHLFGAAKPDRTIYRAFERAMECSGPSILFFDDLKENVEAARALGWQAELIDPDGDTAGQIRDALKTRALVV